MPDQTIDCVDCSLPFTFTEKEQAFYKERGLTPTKRCVSCRSKRRREREGQPPQQFHEATCAKCNATCQVPFVPRGDKPVYCHPCFKQIQNPR